MSYDLREFDAIVWTDVLARMHPLVLHLPIGLFVALAWLEFWGWFKKASPDKRRGQGALVWLLVLTTPLGAATGWLLHEGGGYPEEVEWHEWGGISLAFVSLLAGWSFWRRWKLYPWLVWFGMLLLIPTAHLGATLTHGEEFLLEPWLEEQEPELKPLWHSGEPGQAVSDLTQEAEVPGDGVSREPILEPKALEFADVLPILEARCTRCHGAKKQRGDLALHTEEAALRGGEYEGPALVPGDPEGSPILQRLRLPLDHDDHMPPENKPQPTEPEIAWLEAWIAGRPAPAGELVLEPEEAAQGAAQEPEASEDAPAADSAGPEPAESPAGERDPAAEERALLDLRRRLAHVQALSASGEDLWIDLSGARLEPGELSGLLGPLGARVVELSLAGQALNGDDLARCGNLPRLAHLDLRKARPAAGEPLDLAPLAASRSLRVLNLAGAPLGQGALEVLAGLESLERVFLWNSGLDERLAELAERRPQLELVGASAPPDEALETEDEVVFGEEQGGQGPESATNEACPVSGKPVDPRYTILHEGRAIGFCCPHCPKTFWEDPEAYQP